MFYITIAMLSSPSPPLPTFFSCLMWRFSSWQLHEVRNLSPLSYQVNLSERGPSSFHDCHGFNLTPHDKLTITSSYKLCPFLLFTVEQILLTEKANTFIIIIMYTLVTDCGYSADAWKTTTVFISELNSIPETSLHNKLGLFYQLKLTMTDVRCLSKLMSSFLVRTSFFSLSDTNITRSLP